MLKLISCILLLLVALPLSASEQLDTLVSQKRFAEAEALLVSTLMEDENSEKRFLYARLLSWQGKNDKALEQFEVLLKKFPENTDFLLGKARVLFWNKEYAAADEVLKVAAMIAPDYEDISDLRLAVKREVTSNEQKKLLETTTEKTDSVPGSGPRMKVFSSYEYSTLDNGTPAWQELGVGVAYVGYGDLTPVVSWSTVKRFSLEDKSVTADLYFKHANYTAYAGLTYSADSILLPGNFYRTSLGFLARKNFLIEGGFQQRQYRFLTTNAFLLSASVQSRYVDFTYKAATTLIDDSNRTFMSDLKLAFVISKRLSLNYGINFGHELEVDGSSKKNLYEVSGYLLYSQYKLSSDVNINMSYQHQKQGQAYVRNGYSAGLSYQF